jgi:hypothetical protein
MSIKVLNESFYCEDGKIEQNNFRIYEMSDESKLTNYST